MVMQARLVLLALFGLAWWFFGNLYEAVVISPNWVYDSAAQLERLNAFFQRSSPTLYFVPLTQLATMLVWYVTWRNREPSASRPLRWASLFAVLATALNFAIVSTLVTRLFGETRSTEPATIQSLTVRWNSLNALRIALTGSTMVALFEAFRRLDRRYARS